MDREPVESTLIASMRYVREQRLLEVQFRETGHVYQYYDVPPEEYAALWQSESKGIYFNTTFKRHGFRFVRTE